MQPASSHSSVSISARRSRIARTHAVCLAGSASTNGRVACAYSAGVSRTMCRSCCEYLAMSISLAGQMSVMATSFAAGGGDALYLLNLSLRWNSSSAVASPSSTVFASDSVHGFLFSTTTAFSRLLGSVQSTKVLLPSGSFISTFSTLSDAGTTRSRHGRLASDISVADMT